LYADGLAVHIGKSLALFFKALSFSVLVSLLYSFLSPLPFFKPLSTLITKLRYLPLAGITFYLTMLVHDARNIQVYTLMIFTSTFLTTSIISTINSIPQKEIDHARSLGCSRWETLYQLVIIGRIDMLLECIRQNLAIITMMLVTVESLLASVGGIGFLIKNQDKQMNHGKMLALQLIILLLGVGMDAAITGIRKLTFRYTF
jgi:NitT/TauT family transport system permease protein